jgi:CheY-like chemotaxis protein
MGIFANARPINRVWHFVCPLPAEVHRPSLAANYQMNPTLASANRGLHASSLQHGCLRVLCVDDNKDAADSLAAVLELLGCEARACYDGSSALLLFSEFNPDICFIDLNMPGMNGLELAARFRSSAGHRTLLLVAVTALGSFEDRTKTAVTGFHYHLVKPVNTGRCFSAPLPHDPRSHQSKKLSVAMIAIVAGQ